MFNLPPNTKIFLCSLPVDMRKSFDGLSGMVTSHFGQNPLCGHLFVFFSRRKDRMKVLFWDIDGFVLYYKRLERGTFSWLSDSIFGDNNQISAPDFALLISGINPTKIVRQNRYHRMPETSKV